MAGASTDDPLWSPEDGPVALSPSNVESLSACALRWMLERFGGIALDEETLEGCLSVPGLFFPRTRSAYARCVGTDLEGEEIELAAELPAQCAELLSSLEPAPASPAP